MISRRIIPTKLLPSNGRWTRHSHKVVTTLHPNVCRCQRKHTLEALEEDWMRFFDHQMVEQDERVAWCSRRWGGGRHDGDEGQREERRRKHSWWFDRGYRENGNDAVVRCSFQFIWLDEEAGRLVRFRLFPTFDVCQKQWYQTYRMAKRTYYSSATGPVLPALLKKICLTWYIYIIYICLIYAKYCVLAFIQHQDKTLSTVR